MPTREDDRGARGALSPESIHPLVRGHLAAPAGAGHRTPASPELWSGETRHSIARVMTGRGVTAGEPSAAHPAVFHNWLNERAIGPKSHGSAAAAAVTVPCPRGAAGPG